MEWSHRSDLIPISFLHFKVFYLVLFCSIANWPAKLGETEVTMDMRSAFELWGQYANLNFIQVFDPSADIVVAFGSYYHGDRYEIPSCMGFPAGKFNDT